MSRDNNGLEEYYCYVTSFVIIVCSTDWPTDAGIIVLVCGYVCVWVVERGEGDEVWLLFQ